MNNARVLAFLLALSSLATIVAEGADRALSDRVSAQAATVMAARNIGPSDAPGCAVSIVAAGETVFAAGYGSADIEHRVPFGTQTVSESGSVAKQFMAASILMLVERGSLSLDDDVRKYLPEMPDYGAKIRIRDLLHHTSGVREWSTLAALRGYPRFYRKIYTNDDLLKIVSSQHALNFAPGERFEYSNSNYGLLTVILERVSGLSAREFGRRFIFEPLGMRSTQWRDDLRAIVPGRAVAYRHTASGFEQAMPTENVYGHGALLTSVEDLQRWGQALVNGGLSPFVTRQLLSPAKLNSGEERAYGGGLRLTSYRGHEVYRHGGVTAGYTAQIWAFPIEQLSIAFLCNVSPGDTDEMAARMADAALALEEPARATTSPASGNSTDAPDVASSFFMSRSGELAAVRSSAGRAFVNLFTRAGFMEATPDAGTGTLSATREGYGRMEFRFDGSDRLVVSTDGREPMLYSRTQRAQPTVRISGRYASEDLGAIYDVLPDKSGYRMKLVDLDADDPLRFKLEWLNGDTYVARIESRSGYLRDDFVATFSPAAGGRRARMAISSVAGLQAVDQLEFVRTRDAR